jgi:energy-coupling factor transport system ATP-binding protein
MKAEGLCFAWQDGTEVLHGIDLEIPTGSKIGLMGANGSGKSTLALCFKGLLTPTAGTLCDAQGEALEPGRPNPQVGLVFQNPDNQLITTSVERELAFGLENLALPRDEMYRRVEQALERFDLQKLRNRAPHQLSGGERQKVACAAVLITEPQLLILDEATSLLDPGERRHLLELVFEECERRTDKGMSLFMITQYPEEVEAMDQLVILKSGTLWKMGTPHQVFCNGPELEAAGLGVPIAYVCR